MDLDLVYCWIARIFITIILCCTIYTFHSNELSMKPADGQHNSAPNVHHQILKYWSRICYVGCIISSFLLLTTTIKQSCIYTFGFAACFTTLTKVSVTFYQVARLQYCFSLQCHSYGYHKSVFAIFYIVGFICVILIFMLSYFFSKSSVNTTKFQCVFVSLKGIKGMPLFLTTVLMLVYLIWDWSLLIAYIFKIYQLSHNSKDNEKVSKIKMILKKIAVLTLLFECSFIYRFVIRILSLETSPIRIAIASLKIQPLLDISFSMGIMYLMIDYNNDQYLKLVRVLRTLKLCFCCASFLLVTPLNNGSADAGIGIEITNGNKTVTETKDIMPKNSRTTMTNLKTTSKTNKSITLSAEPNEIYTGNEESDQYDPERTTTSDLERYRELNKKQLNALRAGKRIHPQMY